MRCERWRRAASLVVASLATMNVLAACSTSDQRSDAGAATLLDAGLLAAATDAGERDPMDASSALLTDTSHPEDGSASAEADASHANDEGADAAADSGGDGATSALAALPYAQGAATFTPGAHAGFGEADYPDVILGPPQGKGTNAGSLDVLSLGVGGTIVLTFGARDLVDGPGPDFIVFENAFWAGGDATKVFAEPAEVSVSADGTVWSTFACDVVGSSNGRFPGCAGWTPTNVYDPLQTLPLDPAVTGGDAFDLADLGLTHARFVKIHDLSTTGSADNAGFDLDAVGLIHYGDR